MAPKNKSKAKSKAKLKTRPKRVEGKARSGRAIVTTDVGPSLDPRGLGLSGSQEIEHGMRQLGRATDALVKRVVSSASEGSRDPAEFVLDISKAYYQEETSLGSHNVRCDRCGLKSPGMASVEHACRVAETLGWFVSAKADYCPVCKDGSKLLAPGTAALKSFGLSAGDMVIVVRLRWIASKIASHTSLEALLDNAARSGHRSMLSDFARGFGYDPTALFERILVLANQHADLPEEISTSEGKEFLTDLFSRLIAEDEPT